MAFTYDFQINQGERTVKPFVWKTGAPALPVNLTGCTAKMQVRASVAASSVLKEFSTLNGRLVLGGSNGRITIDLSGADTNVSWRDGVFDLWITFPDGTTKKLLEGTITVKPSVTRA